MSFKILSLWNWQRLVVLVCACAATLFFSAQMVEASPGAHGPNGEHLDASNNIAVSENPKFESFTETFELLGELFEDQLVIYLHDFKSNTPVEGAVIELESGGLSSSIEYSELLKAYTLTNQEMFELLSKEGEHEIVLIVMTEDTGDLLSASLTNLSSHSPNDDHDEDHHHHFPWWAVFLSLVVFVSGYFLGRSRKENKS